MSNIYLSEPPTSGKVLIHTNFGDIDVELWAKECPLACRNFVQHCVNGYYNNNIFHRVIKDFMVQTGDPTNTGKGGESIWGRPFKDEIHQRIKFNHRGQVACANEQEPNSNHSQFFLTLGACDWLDRKHTIFGKVTGNTIFNLLRIGDVDVDNMDKPMDDIAITSIEVLSNPFDDIVPSEAALALQATAGTTAVSASKSAAAAGKSARKSTKDNKLLSFGDEEEEEEMAGEGSSLAAAIAYKKKRAAAASSSGTAATKTKSMNDEEVMSASGASTHLGKRKAGASSRGSDSPLSTAAGCSSSNPSTNCADEAVAVETTAMKIARLKKELARSLDDSESAAAGSTTRSSNGTGDGDGNGDGDGGGPSAAGKVGTLLQQRAKYTARVDGKKLRRGDEGYEEAMLAKLSKFSAKVGAQSWAM